MKRLILSLTALLMTLTLLAGCTPKKPDPVSYEVRLGVLKGPTGIGASYLLEKNEKGETLNKYDVKVEAEATAMVSMLASGELDMAALPTNVASSLYNKTDGGVKLIALNTAGVLYILEKGNTVSSIADLKGKTIYAVGQGSNPEYVLRYILENNGLKEGEDYQIEFRDSAELTTKAAAGDIEVCMLPVPAATTVLTKNKDMRSAVDLSKEWDALNNGSVLTMGCVAVRSEYYQQNKQAVEQFLKEYEESISYVKANVQEAAQLCEKFEIVPAAAIAAKAIPDANLIFVAGKDIRAAIEGYYKVLFEANPQSIGGKLPGDDFYPGE